MTSRDDPNIPDPSAAPRSPLAKPGFRTDIEGLRAIAVLAVVLFHADIPGIGGGFIGVDVFFVISGFLITGLLWREVGGTDSVRLRGFWGARARRLLPASAFVGVVTAITLVILVPPLLAKTFLIDGIASALYVSNFWFFLQATDYFASETIPSPFQHYWSLGVEEQFYLVWPLVIICTAWLIRRMRRRSGAHALPSKTPYLVVLSLIAVTSLAASVIVTRLWPTAAFYLLPTRAWELAFGGLVALTVSQWGRIPLRVAAIVGWIGIGAVLFACYQFSATTLFPGTAALIPVVGTALVIGAGCAAPDRGVGRVLSWRPMRAIGELSYSWYLWHWPVLVLAPILVGHPLSLPWRLVAVLVSAVLAVLTLRLIENPLRFAGRVRRSAGWSLALGGAATAVAVCVAVVLLVTMPAPVGRGPAAPAVSVNAAPIPPGQNIEVYDTAVQGAFAQVEAAVAASADLTAVPSNLEPPVADAAAEKTAMLLGGCMRTVLEVGQPECAMGDTASSTTIALVGDSNAAMWDPALRQVAEQRHWRLETMAKAGCPLLDVTIYDPTLRRDYTECNQWRDQILTRLDAERPKLVVLALSRLYRGDTFESYDPRWIETLTHLVKQLRGTGAELLLLGPIPEPGSVVPVCLSGHLDDVAACTAQRSVAVNESGIAAEIVATKAGDGQYADITSLFCTAQRCPPIVGNTLVYLDEYHLTLEYSRLLGPVIGTLIDRTLANG
ncbi:SGNH hydrolase domain-containing protein [Mycobacterium sp. 2YAF39]|uniref:acyltransferase family protein n=1 Tax=Mycobacterium sp. 2YAF39 TaxID=3233033 RepID=UPI003F9985CB